MFGYILHRLTVLKWTWFYRLFGTLFFKKIGKDCKFEGFVKLPQKAHVCLGDGVIICKGVTLSASNGGKICVGDNAYIGGGTIISSQASIIIGKDCLISPSVSIYDNNHNTTDYGKSIQSQGFIAKELVIGEDCWIGTKAILVMGSGLGDKCILGAGSILTKEFDKGSVIAGVPAKKIKERLGGQ